MGSLKIARGLILFLLTEAYILFLASRDLPLYDPRPWMNLGLRLLMMDLFPLLWALWWFWRKLDGWPDFLQNLSINAREKPLPLAAPALAMVLFILESGGAILSPSSAGPTPLVSVLWMQAATAMMAAIVLSFGTTVRPGRVSPPRFGKTYAIFLTGIGLAYFLATHCDISRLLMVMGLASLGIQKVIVNSRRKSRPGIS